MLHQAEAAVRVLTSRAQHGRRAEELEIAIAAGLEIGPEPAPLHRHIQAYYPLDDYRNRLICDAA